MSVRIFIVEDHPITLIGYRELIQTAGDLEVVGEAGAASEAIDGISDVKPDLVLIDLELPGVSGLELVKQLRGQYPNLKMLVVSGHDEVIYAERALRAGAGGYLMKHEMTDRILYAIRQVARGQLYLSREMNERLLRRHVVPPEFRQEETLLEKLSDRELEVLRHIGNGYSTKEIADRMLISPKTVEAHRSKIKQKLSLQDASEIMRFATLCFHSLR